VKRVPNILWICDRSLEKGGVACALYDLYPALSRTACDIVFAAPKNAAFPRLEALGATVHKVLPTFPKGRGYVWSLLSCFSILRLAFRLKPDMVVADHTNGLWLVLFLKAIRFPTAATYRNHGVEFLVGRPRLARLISRCVDQIVTVSQPEADALQRLTNHAVNLVPNCLPAHCLAQGPLRAMRKDPESPTVAYVGWLNKAKGIYAFLDLVAEIRKDLPSAQGIAIGRISLERDSKVSREELLERMREAGIKYLGEVPRERIFREVDFLLVCSRRESFGLTALEAPFFDVTPIAYDSPGTHFLLGSVPECLIDNGEIEQMKDTVVRLWRRPNKRSELCGTLRTRFQRQFDPNLVAANLIAVFANNK
jgi:glycosyltransferase involved in cell wall biosynthesis